MFVPQGRLECHGFWTYWMNTWIVFGHFIPKSTPQLCGDWKSKHTYFFRATTLLPGIFLKYCKNFLTFDTIYGNIFMSGGGTEGAPRVKIEIKITVTITPAKEKSPAPNNHKAQSNSQKTNIIIHNK